jgi:hypothetical protein
LEKIFQRLMVVSSIPVEEPFRIEGEQIDGAIKYDGHYYLIEAKGTEAKTDPKEMRYPWVGEKLPSPLRTIQP